MERVAMAWLEAQCEVTGVQVRLQSLLCVLIWARNAAVVRKASES
jgi:hypothetical protein